MLISSKVWLMHWGCTYGQYFLPPLPPLPPLSPSLPQGLEDTPLLQFFSCSENHLPKVEGMNHTPLLQHLCLSQNNLQEVAEHFTLLTNYTLHIWLAHCSPPSLPPSLHPDTCLLPQIPSLPSHVLLRELRLDENSLSSVSPIATAWLPLLQTLTLTNNW